MVCLQDQLPLLKYGNQEVVSYEARWLSEQITKSAQKAGHKDWFFAADITRAVIAYLRHRHPGNTITLEELYRKVEYVLEYLGCDDIARSLEIAPPSLSISLPEIARDARGNCEPGFFQLLSERLAAEAGGSASQIHCEGVEEAARILSSSARWNSECEQLSAEIAEFASRELQRLRPRGNVGLLLN